MQPKFVPFSLNKNLESPETTPQRRRSKMRFSFLAGSVQSPDAKGSRRKARPSLALLDDFPEPPSARPLAPSPLKESTPVIEERSPPSTSTESRIPKPSSMLPVTNQFPKLAPPPKQRDSTSGQSFLSAHANRDSIVSRLSTVSSSEFFDAQEELSHMETIAEDHEQSSFTLFENDELRDLRSPVRKRADTLTRTSDAVDEHDKPPRLSFVRRELAKLEAELAEEAGEDISGMESDETITPFDDDDEASEYFDDLEEMEPAKEGDLVMLDTVSLNSRSRSRRPCTSATVLDVQQLKRKATKLIRYEESEDIYADLVDRLQRMMKRESEESLLRLARWLKDWLEKIEEGRIITGENARMVKHEVEWATWVEEAVRKGVLHVKRDACRCEREWSM